MIVDERDIRKDTVWKIVIEDLKKRVVFSCFVLHALTAEQEEGQVAACQGLVEIADSYPDYFKKNCNLMLCVMKCQLSAYVGRNSPWPQKLRFHKS